LTSDGVELRRPTGTSTKLSGMVSAPQWFACGAEVQPVIADRARLPALALGRRPHRGELIALVALEHVVAGVALDDLVVLRIWLC
jgi:hypothetical protein